MKMLSEKQEAEIGENIAFALHLKKIRTGPEKGRYRTTWGTKTPLGLYRTILSQINQFTKEALKGGLS